jgi:hypothetical protein
MTPAQGNVDQSGTFKVDNEFAQGMNVGVTCQLELQGSVVPGPVTGAFYVTPDPMPTGFIAQLTPVDKVTLWFEANASTGSMIAEIVGNQAVVDFTGSNPKTQTITYNANGQWQ